MSKSLTHRQNVAVTLAKAYHLIATATGSKWHIDNASEHLDVALLGNGEAFDFDATREAIKSITDLAIMQADIAADIDN